MVAFCIVSRISHMPLSTEQSRSLIQLLEPILADPQQRQSVLAGAFGDDLSTVYPLDPAAGTGSEFTENLVNRLVGSNIRLASGKLAIVSLLETLIGNHQQVPELENYLGLL